MTSNALAKSGEGKASALAIVFGLRAPVTRKSYLIAGTGLMLLKYGLEYAVFAIYTQKVLTPLAFVTPFFMYRAELLRDAPSFVTPLLIALSMPFLYVGVTMSVRRAIDASVSPVFGFAFMIPGVHYVVMAALSLFPSGWGREASALEQARADAPAPPPPPPPEPPPPDAPARGYRDPAAPSPPEPPALPAPAKRRAPPDLSRMLPEPAPAVLPVPADRPTEGRSIVLRTIVCASIGVFMSLFCVRIMGTYGTALFMGTPALMAFVGAVSFSRADSALGCVVGSFLLAGGALLIFAFEGLLCLMMAAVPAAAMGAVGFALGRALRERIDDRDPKQLLGVALLPIAAAIEAPMVEPPIYDVSTSVVIDAPPEVVWEHVVAFAPLDEPDEFMFRAGVAYPKSANIEGSGVGAVRYCNFSTGSFVEPITAWEPGERLAFDVEQNPPPMRELSPYETVDAPHLHGFMRSRRGEFRLRELPGGRTLLEGTTEYQLDIFPETYWKAWTDTIVHAIHRRVLEHVARESERDAGRRK
ncbi:MAG: SRPBCC family protein [Polyangiaceae bacterium]|nr:SRPBCC family protein [Polyangiaceae bacterium]